LENAYILKLIINSPFIVYSLARAYRHRAVQNNAGQFTRGRGNRAGCNYKNIRLNQPVNIIGGYSDRHIDDDFMNAFYNDC
jgi:hypothetical protein